MFALILYSFQLVPPSWTLKGTPAQRQKMTHSWPFTQTRLGAGGAVEVGRVGRCISGVQVGKTGAIEGSVDWSQLQQDECLDLSRCFLPGRMESLGFGESENHLSQIMALSNTFPCCLKGCFLVRRLSISSGRLRSHVLLFRQIKWMEVDNWIIHVLVIYSAALAMRLS